MLYFCNYYVYNYMVVKTSTILTYTRINFTKDACLQRKSFDLFRQSQMTFDLHTKNIDLILFYTLASGDLKMTFDLQQQYHKLYT